MLHNDFIKENFMINWLKNLLGFGTTAVDKESEDAVTVSVKEDDVTEEIKNNPNWPFPEGTGSPEINMNTGAWPFPTSISTVNIDGQAADYLINVDDNSIVALSNLYFTDIQGIHQINRTTAPNVSFANIVLDVDSVSPYINGSLPASAVVAGQIHKANTAGLSWTWAKQAGKF